MSAPLSFVAPPALSASGLAVVAAEAANPPEKTMNKQRKASAKARNAIPHQNSTVTAKRRKPETSEREAKAAVGSTKVKTKTEKVLALLTRPGGASIVDLTAATGWLPHTTRAALTGLRKRGHAIETERQQDGPTIYHLIPPTPVKASRKVSGARAKA
jgi:hypothetical protein